MANTTTVAEPSEPPLSTAGELHERGRHLDLAIEALRTKVRNREATGAGLLTSTKKHVGQSGRFLRLFEHTRPWPWQANVQYQSALMGAARTG